MEYLVVQIGSVVFNYSFNNWLFENGHNKYYEKDANGFPKHNLNIKTHPNKWGIHYPSNYNNYDYPNTKTNLMDSQLLWGKGVALDYVTYYDKILRIEYSINHLGEKGVFLHFSNPFGSKK